MYEGQNTAMGISHLCRYKVDTELRSAVQCTVEALTLKRPTKFFVLQKNTFLQEKRPTVQFVQFVLIQNGVQLQFRKTWTVDHWLSAETLVTACDAY